MATNTMLNDEGPCICLSQFQAEILWIYKRLMNGFCFKFFKLGQDLQDAQDIFFGFPPKNQKKNHRNNLAI